MRTKDRHFLLLVVLATVCAQACTGETKQLQPKPLVIQGDYRGVGYRLELLRLSDSHLGKTELDCLFRFESSVWYVPSASPPGALWETVDGAQIWGELIRPGPYVAAEEPNQAQFRIGSFPAEIAGGKLSFIMEGLGFEARLSPGSRGLVVDLMDKSIPIWVEE